MSPESVWIRTTDTLPMARKPKLTVFRDMNDYPATARCSSCGEAMPVRQEWIISAGDNLAWFPDQIQRHITQQHPFWTGSPEGARAIDRTAA